VGKGVAWPGVQKGPVFTGRRATGSRRLTAIDPPKIAASPPSRTTKKAPKDGSDALVSAASEVSVTVNDPSCTDHWFKELGQISH
jgi:hypothetical protein